jgi:hypothetical protein
MKERVLFVVAMGLVACSSSSNPSASAGAAGELAAGTGGTSTTAGGSSSGGSVGTAGEADSGGSAGMISAAGSAGAASCTKCPTACCDGGAQCVDDGLGNLSCKKSCVTSSECPASAQCCELLKDGTGVCADGTGANLCRCTTGAECSSKACAPNIDAMSNPVGPYVCVPDDGAAYHGCNGPLVTCGGTSCCFIDAQKNAICVETCTNDSQCGAAACVTYPAKSSTCSGMLGCGPK